MRKKKRKERGKEGRLYTPQTTRLHKSSFPQTDHGTGVARAFIHCICEKFGRSSPTSLSHADKRPANDAGAKLGLRPGLSRRYYYLSLSSLCHNCPAVSLCLHGRSRHVATVTRSSGYCSLFINGWISCNFP